MLMDLGKSRSRRDAHALVARTLEALTAPEPGRVHANAVNNMFRMLQDYRAHGFFGYGDGSIAAALSGSFSDAFADREPGEAIGDMRGVFRQAAFPRDGVRVPPEHIAGTRHFLAALRDRLAA